MQILRRVYRVTCNNTNIYVAGDSFSTIGPRCMVAACHTTRVVSCCSHIIADDQSQCRPSMIPLHRTNYKPSNYVCRSLYTPCVVCWREFLLSPVVAVRRAWFSAVVTRAMLARSRLSSTWLDSGRTPAETTSSMTSLITSARQPVALLIFIDDTCSLYSLSSFSSRTQHIYFIHICIFCNYRLPVA